MKKMILKTEECPVCKQIVGRIFFKDVKGKKLSHLERHLKDGLVCIKGSMNLMDLMVGKQFTGSKPEIVREALQ